MGGRATVSGNASRATDAGTIRHYAASIPLKLARYAVRHRDGAGHDSDAQHVKAKYTLFRRGGIYYSQNSATGQQKSLRTRDESEALQLVNARNEAPRQPVLNLHLARSYLAARDPASVERTWQTVMARLQARGKERSRECYTTVFKSANFDTLRHKKLLETTADDFLSVFGVNGQLIGGG